jgi:arginase family enzyme
VNKFGVTCIEMKDFFSDIPIALQGPVYISIDMDVLDPAFAPGVSHHEPGGLSTRDLLHLINAIDNPIVGVDIVEFNPSRDVQGITAGVASKLLKEVAGKMLKQSIETIL